MRSLSDIHRRIRRRIRRRDEQTNRHRHNDGLDENNNRDAVQVHSKPVAVVGNIRAAGSKPVAVVGNMRAERSTTIDVHSSRRDEQIFEDVAVHSNFRNQQK